MNNDPRNLNRPVGDPMLNRDASGRKLESGRNQYIAPVLIAAALVLGGLYFFSGSGDRTTTTANNSRGEVTSTAPVQTPAPVPGPAKSTP